MILSFFHHLLLVAYVLLPIVAALHATLQIRRRRVRATVNLIITITIASVVATAATGVYAISVDGRVGPAQFALAIYFTIAVLIIINLLDLLVARLLRLASRGKIPLGAAALLRGLVLAGVGLPYIVASAMTYRPRVAHSGNPASILHRDFQPVQFESTDGITLSGWWIAALQPRVNRDPDSTAKTVLICPGFGADKATQLIVARRLVAAGFNVLAFDFRAHGSSGGRFSSLGDLERRDVLGAVHWLRTVHSKGAQDIFGLGIGSGAAALIGAAVDPGADGQAIQSLVVYGPYDDLSLLTNGMFREGFVPVIDWLIPRVGLRLASLNVGADLTGFKPASLVPQLWPRPIFVIHGVYDHIVPFDRGRALFDAATFPKQSLWVPREDLEDTLRDDDVSRAVLHFFQTTKSSPMI